MSFTVYVVLLALNAFDTAIIIENCNVADACWRNPPRVDYWMRCAMACIYRGMLQLVEIERLLGGARTPFLLALLGGEKVAW